MNVFVFILSHFIQSFHISFSHFVRYIPISMCDDEQCYVLIVRVVDVIQLLLLLFIIYFIQILFHFAYCAISLYCI